MPERPRESSLGACRMLSRDGDVDTASPGHKDCATRHQAWIVDSLSDLHEPETQPTSDLSSDDAEVNDYATKSTYSASEGTDLTDEDSNGVQYVDEIQGRGWLAQGLSEPGDLNDLAFLSGTGPRRSVCERSGEHRGRMGRQQFRKTSTCGNLPVVQDMPSLESEKVHTPTPRAKAPARVPSKAWPRFRRSQTLNQPEEQEVDQGHPQISWPSVTPEQTEESLDYHPRMKFLCALASPTSTVADYVQALEVEVKGVVSAECCAVFFVDDVREHIWYVGREEKAFSMPWTQGVVGLAARQGARATFAGTASAPNMPDPVLQLFVDSVRSLICLPIRHMLNQTRNIGVIAAINRAADSADAWTERDVKVLQDLARLASDSFYRQRWKALESGSSRGDSQALSIISRTRECGMKAASLSDKMRWVEVPEEPRSTGLLQMRQLGFDSLQYAPDELVRMVGLVLENTGCIEQCAVPSQRIRDWALAAKNMYRDNPFHNWFHGFSVFQMCYYTLHVAAISDVLSVLDVFGLLIAALCHDLDHPGFTNSFMVDSESELALRHNDIAVLENHHASLACELLRRDSTAIAAGLDRAAQTSLRRVVIKCILDTDMAVHSDMCGKLMASTVTDDRQLMLSACIHTCDLSAQVMPWKIAAKWEERVSMEFTRQAAEELAGGRTPAPFMNFKMDDMHQRGKLQKDFCDFVLLPLWDPYTQLFPTMRPCYRNLVKNRSYYEHRWTYGEDPDPERN